MRYRATSRDSQTSLGSIVCSVKLGQREQLAINRHPKALRWILSIEARGETTGGEAESPGNRPRRRPEVRASARDLHRRPSEQSPGGPFVKRVTASRVCRSSDRQYSVEGDLATSRANGVISYTIVERFPPEGN